MKFMKSLIGTILLALGFTASANLVFPIHMQYVQAYRGYQDNAEKSTTTDVRLTMHTDPVVAGSDLGYYAMYNMWFENYSFGYTGLQKDAAGGKKVLFSMWDQGGKTSAVDSKCRRFDHEGDGTQCIASYQWVAGHEYKFFVKKGTQTGTNADTWTATITDMVTKQTTVIGTIAVPDTTGYKGYGSIISHTFVQEYYGPSGVTSYTCSALPQFIVEWNMPVLDNGYRPRQNVYTSATGIGANCTNKNVVATGPWSYKMTSGGNAEQNHNNDAVLSDPINYVQNRKLECFFDGFEGKFNSVLQNKGVAANVVSHFDSTKNILYRDYTKANALGVKEGWVLMTDLSTGVIMTKKMPEDAVIYGGKHKQYANDYNCAGIV